MNFDNEELINDFLKGIKSQSFSRNMQALSAANELMADGSEIDFAEILEENEAIISERLADVLNVFPFEPENYDFYKGGEFAVNHYLEVLITKPSELTSFDERKTILENLDGYFEKLADGEANSIGRASMNISKTEYEMLKIISNEEFFDPSLAISIKTMNGLLDELNPAYVRENLKINDVKAIIATLDSTINEDFNVGSLSQEVGKFVKAAKSSSRTNEELFKAMTIFANASVYGIEEEAIYNKLLTEEVVDDAAIKKYFNTVSKTFEFKRSYSVSDEDLAAGFDAEFDPLEEEDEPKRKRKYAI